MFAQRLKELRKERNMTQIEFAKKFNISSGTIAMWETGKRTPDNEMMIKIADYFNVTVDYLLGRTNYPNAIVKTTGYVMKVQENNKTTDIETLPSSNIRMIPLFESVSAGFGAYADSCVIGYEPVYIENEYEAENTLAIKVKGNSMYPKIEDGDIVVVCKDMDYEDGSIVVALIDGDDGVVKKIKRSQNSIILESINPEYMPRVFEGSEMNRIRIVGVVRKIVKSV